MYKFLRKYQKWILAIGGTLLMIAFLLPTALTQGGMGRGDHTVARMGGKKIKASELGRASMELALITNDAEDAFGRLLKPVFPALAQIEKPEHWYMLTREAKRMGYIATAAQVDTMMSAVTQGQTQLFIRDIQQLPQSQIQDAIKQLEQIPQIVQQYRATVSARHPVIGEETLRSVASVMMMLEGYGGATRASEPRARSVAQQSDDRADIDVVTIRADTLLDKIPDPDEAALLNHFEQHKSRPRGAGEASFGYLLPAALKIEWLTVGVTQLADAVKPDPVEVRKRWQSSRDKYKGEFADERTAVENDVRREQIAAAVREADQVVRGEAAQDSRRYPDDGRWKRVPDAWASDAKTLDTIAGSVADRLEARLGKRIVPLVIRRDEWLARNDLATLPGIGRARIPVGARLAAFPDIIPEVREIAGREARGFQVGIIYGPANDEQGNAHYFRILAARQEGPPASIDLVRAEVARDVKRLTAFESLKARRDDLLALIRAKGFEGLYAEFPGAVAVPASTSRRQAFVAGGSLDVQEFRDAVMDAAARLDPTKPVAQAPAEQRYVAVAVPQALALAVAEIKGLDLVSNERFREQVARLLIQARAQDQDVPTADRPFTFERLKQRLGWQDLARAREDESDTGPKVSAPKPNAANAPSNAPGTPGSPGTPGTPGAP